MQSKLPTARITGSTALTARAVALSSQHNSQQPTVTPSGGSQRKAQPGKKLADMNRRPPSRRSGGDGCVRDRDSEARPERRQPPLRLGPWVPASGILTTWTRFGKTVHMCLNMVLTCTLMFLHLHTDMNMYVHGMYKYINICRCTYMFMHSYLCLYIVHTHA